MSERYETEDIPGDYGLPIRTEIIRDNGGKLPAGLDYFHNLLNPPGPFMRLLKRKRKHAITVRKLSGWYGNFWKFSCTPCGLSINHPTWETAYTAADHHARNHHRR